MSSATVDEEQWLVKDLEGRRRDIFQYAVSYPFSNGNIYLCEIKSGTSLETYTVITFTSQHNHLYGSHTSANFQAVSWDRYDRPVRHVDGTKSSQIISVTVDWRVKITF